jgi:hypothetical protein
MRPLRIVDWDKHFENAASRKLKSLDWVSIPNKMDGSGYTALLDHPNGAAHLGAWYAMVEIASRQTKRGNLPFLAGICQCLGRISRIPAEVFEEVIPRLLEIGWIEEIQQVTDKSPNVSQCLPTSADQVADSGKKMALQDKTLHKTLSAAVVQPASVVETAPSITTTAPVVKSELPPPPIKEIKQELQDLVNRHDLLRSPKPSKETCEEMKARLELHEHVKQALITFPGAERLPGKPDDLIIGKCLELANEDETILAAALVRMAKAGNGKRPTTSWAWFPTVLPQYLGEKT